MTAVRRQLADGRWHFQHGPIDCILHAEGAPGAAPAGIERAWARFGVVLEELVAELPLLRAPLSHAIAPRGPIARRMVDACLPFARDGTFVTAMAAVAGSVADELLECVVVGGGLHRVCVNDGGDIALHLAPGFGFVVGMADEAAMLHGQIHVDHATPVRGIATSGWRGRSLSLGIADAVTVLARTGAQADAAATMIANAVDLDDPDAHGIVRRPADTVRDDSDLGARLVTVAVPPLAAAAVDRALARGVQAAERCVALGRIAGAALRLQGRTRTCGEIARALPERTRIGLS